MHTPDRFTPDSARGESRTHRHGNQRPATVSSRKSAAVPCPACSTGCCKARARHDDERSRNRRKPPLEPHTEKPSATSPSSGNRSSNPVATGSNARPTRPHAPRATASSGATWLFSPGDTLNPQLIVRNKQLIRSRGYIADIDDGALDSLDSTRVNFSITIFIEVGPSHDGGIH